MRGFSWRSWPGKKRMGAQRETGRVSGGDEESHIGARGTSAARRGRAIVVVAVLVVGDQAWTNAVES